MNARKRKEKTYIEILICKSWSLLKRSPCYQNEISYCKTAAKVGPNLQVIIFCYLPCVMVASGLVSHQMTGCKNGVILRKFVCQFGTEYIWVIFSRVQTKKLVSWIVRSRLLMIALCPYLLRYVHKLKYIYIYIKYKAHFAIVMPTYVVHINMDNSNILYKFRNLVS